MTAPATPTYVDFLFYRLAPSFRAEPAAARRDAADEFLRLLESPGIRGEVRPYSCLGFRAPAELLLWVIVKRLSEAQAFAASVYRTRLGARLEATHAYLAVTKPSPYTKSHPQHFEAGPSPHEYLVVYPFTKTHDWYLLPLEERRKMMEEHRRAGEAFPQIKLNTTYSFGIGDQDFMLAFECDEPVDFVDLVQKLRETQARRYTAQDTPFFVCRKAPAREIVESILGL